MKKENIVAHNAPAAIGPYSQALKAGDFLYISGQIPISPVTGSLIKGSVQEQTHQVMKNIGAILSVEGLTFDHIVKSSIFLDSMSRFADVNLVYASYFEGIPPARECIGGLELPKGASIEISVIAAY